jgi:hypothetical protein
MVRVILGIVKGGLVGAALGFAGMRLGLGSGVLAWALYGAVGLLVGIVCGKAPWRHETFWTPLLKGIFGVLVCLGLTWVGRKVLGGVILPLNAQVGAPPDAPLTAVPLFFAPLLGVLYGIFVEIDDGDRKKADAAGKPA